MREKEERLFLLALGLTLLSVFFFYSLFLGEVFYLRDIFQNHYPVEKAAAGIIRSGDLPLWNPYQGFGEPLLADPTYNLLYPPMFLFYLLPTPYTFSLLIILHFFAGGLFLFLLSKELGLKNEGAFFAASVYTFSGFILSFGNIANNLFTITWAPLALLLFIRLTEKRRLKELLLFSLVLALSLLGGGYINLLLIFTLIGLYGLFPIKDGKATLARRAGNIGYLLAGGASSFLLTAILNLPALELFRHSVRARGLPLSEVNRFSLNPKRLIELIVPNFFGSPTNRYFTEFWGRVFFDRGYPLFLSIYIGALPLVLVVIAILRARRKALFFAGVGTLGFFLSLGRYLPYARLFSRLPLINSLRYPAKAFYLTIFSLALLAGIGLEILLFRKREEEKRILNICLLILGIIVIVLAAIYLIGKIKPGLLESTIRLIYIPAQSAPFFSKLASKMAMKGFLRALIVAAAAFGIILLSEHKRFPPLLTFTLATSLVVVDLFSANCSINPTISPGFFSYKPRAVLMIEREHDKEPFRIFRDKRPKNLGLALPSPSLEWGFIWERDVLRPVTGIIHHLSYAFDTNIDKSNLKEYISLVDFFNSLTKKERLKLLSLTNVRYILSFDQLDLPGLRLVDEFYPRSNISLKIYANNFVLPRAYLVGKVLPAQSREEELSLLLSPEVAGGEAAVVSAEENIPSFRDNGGEGNVKIISYSPGKIVLKTSSPGEELLVLTETCYPGWQVSVDGKRWQVKRVNYLFHGVFLPPGDHDVTFRYRPKSLYYGAIISLISLGFILIAFTRVKRKEKRSLFDRFRQFITDKFCHFLAGLFKRK
jgi:hypothetical protein